MMSLSKVNGNAELTVSCDPLDPADEETYSNEAKYDLMMFFKGHRIERKNQKVDFDSKYDDDSHKVRLMDWDSLRRKCSVDGKVRIELQFEIIKMSGVTAKKQIDFGDPMKNYSDVILVVGQEKFHVSKLFLSFQSSYFNTLFHGSFEESNKSEVILQDIDPWDFQKVLELLYGRNSIDDDYFESIFRLVDMFDASIARERCEDFLMEKSKKSLREKLELAVEHKMQNVKEKCLSDIETAEDIRSAVPEKLEQLDPSLMPAILGKALEIINNLLK